MKMMAVATITIIDIFKMVKKRRQETPTIIRGRSQIDRQVNLALLRGNLKTKYLRHEYAILGAFLILAWIIQAHRVILYQ